MLIWYFEELGQMILFILFFAGIFVFNIYVFKKFYFRIWF